MHLRWLPLLGVEEVVGLLAQVVVVQLSSLDLVTLEVQSSALLEGETHCTCCFSLSLLSLGTLEVEGVLLSGPLDDRCHKDRLPRSVRSRRPHTGRACGPAMLVLYNSRSPYPAPPV